MTQKRSKKYLESIEKFEKDKYYEPEEAFELVKKLSWAKFDESVDIAIKLGVDTGVDLPHGTGKKIRIAVFAQGEKAKEAEEAGADFVGGEDLAEKIQKGWTDFEATIATPDMMKVLGKLGKILGPRGLMPNPKLGTVTFEIKNAIKALKAGKVEYRADKFGIIHASLGRLSFDKEKLLDNLLAFMEAIIKAKPSAAKGRYLESIIISSTMGPGIKIDPLKISTWVEEHKK